MEKKICPRRNAEPQSHSKRKKAARLEPRNDIGKAIMLFTGGCDGFEKREWGPMAEITEEPMTYAEVVRQAQEYSSGRPGDFFNIDNKSEKTVRPLFVFSPHGLPDNKFLSIAAINELSFAEAAKAHKAIKWIKTGLRGVELLAFVRRVIHIANPYAVVLWPMGYILAGIGDNKSFIATETGWLLPASERYPRASASTDYHFDSEDPQDWWKK